MQQLGPRGHSSCHNDVITIYVNTRTYELLIKFKILNTKNYAD